LTRRRTIALLSLSLAACEPTRFREVEVGGGGTSPATRAAAAEDSPRLRFSVAAVESPRDTYSAYARLFGRLAEQVGRGAEFVQRPSYREVNELLASGKIDVALLCTGGWLELRRTAPGAAEVLAVPIVNGEASYRSLIIVPTPSPAGELGDLAGKRFAFTDRLSLSGRSYLVRLLQDRGVAADRFFGAVTFTRSHDRSIAAVARGIVDGAAVHSVVLSLMIARDPALAGKVRVIHASPPFGAMPVVASTRLDPELRRRLQDALVGLAGDPTGSAALRELGMERFRAAEPGLHEGAARWVESRP